MALPLHCYIDSQGEKHIVSLLSCSTVKEETYDES